MFFIFWMKYFARFFPDRFVVFGKEYISIKLMMHVSYVQFIKQIILKCSLVNLPTSNHKRLFLFIFASYLYSLFYRTHYNTLLCTKIWVACNNHIRPIW